MAPELLKVLDFVEDGVDDDKAEVAVVDLSLEALQEAGAVALLHRGVVLVLQYLECTDRAVCRQGAGRCTQRLVYTQAGVHTA